MRTLPTRIQQQQREKNPVNKLPWPAGSAVVLSARAEERHAGDGADPGPLRLDPAVVPVHGLALERPFRARLLASKKKRKKVQ